MSHHTKDSYDERRGEPRQERKERGGSREQTTPPQCPDKTYRYHGELSGVGCWITRFTATGK